MDRSDRIRLSAYRKSSDSNTSRIRIGFEADLRRPETDFAGTPLEHKSKSSQTASGSALRKPIETRLWLS